MVHTPSAISSVPAPSSRPRLRVAVISDIHGNAHALHAVLAAVEVEAPDAIWCLGDTVGYGARPNECCSLVREAADVCLAGNHDLLAIGKEVLEADFNPDATTASRWTRNILDEPSCSFLDGLEPQARLEHAELFHASARDPVWEYVLGGESALATLELTKTPLVLVGHSHVPFAVSLHRNELSGAHAPAGAEIDLTPGRWLCNPGSVGQPRDGDWRAAWLLVELGERHASFRREEYDMKATQAEIREAGLPASLAERLASGV
jgi:diadenosine tetraphosphatase ApaH/serine/threonine PP2A family protein phosphatase